MTDDGSQREYLLHDGRVLTAGQMCEELARGAAVTDERVEAAARILAQSEEANPNKWPKYANVTRRMLLAAQGV